MLMALVHVGWKKERVLHRLHLDAEGASHVKVNAWEVLDGIGLDQAQAPLPMIHGEILVPTEVGAPPYAQFRNQLDTCTALVRLGEVVNRRVTENVIESAVWQPTQLAAISLAKSPRAVATGPRD